MLSNSSKKLLRVISFIFLKIFFLIFTKISSDKHSNSASLTIDVIKLQILSFIAPFSFFKEIFIYFPNFSIKKRGVPIHFIFPEFIIPILFPKTLASSMKCVVNIIILFSHCVFKISQRFLLEVISIPLEGSSKNIISLPPINAIPIDNFLFCPVDRCLAKVYLTSSN